MVFSSSVFLFAFLPITYILYIIIPKTSLKNILLIIASLVFYAYGEPTAVLLMIVSVLLNYFFGRLMLSDKHKKAVLTIAVVFNVAMLFVFKYLTYTMSLISNILGIDFAVPNIALPIGISFFTFQAMSYVIDAYKDKNLVRKNILDIFLYISFFPQLIAGPIVKFDDIAYQIHNRNITLSKTIDGISRFSCGLAKKIIIANTMGEIADTAFALDTSSLNIAAAWIGAVCYVMQIYFDFSGYSDMAIGLGKMFGFTFKENFNYPLSSRGMTDFWRRWNISVSTWFKEYVYFSLGGNRKGKARTAVNKIIVFILTGIWHGANLTFLLWGIIHGVFLMLESYNIIPKKLFTKKSLAPLLHLYTLLVVTLAFVIFRADNITYAFGYIGAMFTGWDFSASSGFSDVLSLISPYVIIVFIIALCIAMPVKDKIHSIFIARKKERLYTGLKCVGAVCMLILSIFALSTATYNPFIYFRF